MAKLLRALILFSLVFSPAAYAQQACRDLFATTKAEFNFDREEYSFISKLFPEVEMTPEFYKIFKAVSSGQEQMYRLLQKRSPTPNIKKVTSLLKQALATMKDKNRSQQYEPILKKLKEPNVDPIYASYVTKLLKYLYNSRLMKNYQTRMDHSQLSFSEVYILDEYTTTLFILLNKYSSNPDLDLENFNYLNRYINHTLDKLQNYSGSVRRDLDLSPSEIERLKKEPYYEARTLMSTTKSDEPLFFARNCIFLITSKTGKYISSFSAAPREEEVLFKKGTKFKITKFEVNESDKITTFYLDEI